MTKGLTLLFLFLKICLAGQDFPKDWKAFGNKDWLVVFKQTSEVSFGGKPSNGQIQFVCKKDESINVVYSVFIKAEVDSLFMKELLNFYFVQSCSTTAKDSKQFLNSFDFKDYYYVLQPCHYCHTATNTHCYTLADQLFQYILRK